MDIASVGASGAYVPAATTATGGVQAAQPVPVEAFETSRRRGCREDGTVEQHAAAGRCRGDALGDHGGQGRLDLGTAPARVEGHERERLEADVAAEELEIEEARGARVGHEHEIGKTYRMTLNPGTPEEKILLDIPRWDFNWQMNYAPVEKITAS